jgi:hypothetical protein
MGEDKGERGHQTRPKAEWWNGNMIGHKKKTNFMNDFEAMQKDPNVRAMQEEMFDKPKRKFKVDRRAGR